MNLRADSSEDDGTLLGGYRVLDLTDEKGLFCPRLLADYGADVIKIEIPGGESARNIPPFYKNKPHPEKSLFWFYTNLNKRSITLNIGSEEGRGIFKRLVKEADFVIESFEPGYMDSLGLGYSELRKLNPRLVMTSITPFGQDGPYAHYKVTDIVSVAMGGMMRLFGDADRAPIRMSQPQAYWHGSVHATMGTMMAHYYREFHGIGQYVDVSIQQAVVLALIFIVEYWEVSNFNWKCQSSSGYPIRRAKGELNLRRTYPCKDGYVTFIWGGGANLSFLNSSKAFVEMANEEGKLPELKDYDWASLDVAVVEQEEYDRICDLFESVMVTKTKNELLQWVIRDKRPLLAPINTVKDTFDSPQLKERNFWVDVEHAELGDWLTYPGTSVKLSRCPWRVYRRPPLIGEHNVDIYEDELNFSTEEIDLLKTRGII